MLSGSVCCSCTATLGRAVSGGAEGHGNPHHRIGVAHSPWGVIAAGTPWWVFPPPFPEAPALEARRRKTGNLQKTDFTDPWKEREKEGRKRNKEILLYSEMELPWITWKTLPMSVQNCTRLIAYLVIISQFHLHLAQLPEAEKSSNYLFCKSLLLLPSSSLWHLPHPSSFLGPCDLCWARCPKGVIAPPCGRSIAGIPGDSCPWSLQKWQIAEEKNAHTHKNAHNFHNYILRRSLGLYVNSPALPPAMHFQESLKLDSWTMLLTLNVKQFEGALLWSSLLLFSL